MSWSPGGRRAEAALLAANRRRAAGLAHTATDEELLIAEAQHTRCRTVLCTDVLV